MIKKYQLDCLNITNAETYYDEIKKSFSFPDYFGRNYHAILDCLRDIGWEVEESQDVEKAISINCTNFGSLINKISDSYIASFVDLLTSWKSEYPTVNIKITLEL